nr:MAG TPA: hypothetical protein [Caudoviricetes sp.]
MQDKARSVIYVSAPGFAIPEDNNDRRREPLRGI